MEIGFLVRLTLMSDEEVNQKNITLHIQYNNYRDIDQYNFFSWNMELQNTPHPSLSHSMGTSGSRLCRLFPHKIMNKIFALQRSFCSSASLKRNRIRFRKYAKAVGSRPCIQSWTNLYMHIL